MSVLSSKHLITSPTSSQRHQQMVKYRPLTCVTFTRSDKRVHTPYYKPSFKVRGTTVNNPVGKAPIKKRTRYVVDSKFIGEWFDRTIQSVTRNSSLQQLNSPGDRDDVERRLQRRRASRAESVASCRNVNKVECIRKRKDINNNYIDNNDDDEINTCASDVNICTIVDHGGNYHDSRRSENEHISQDEMRQNLEINADQLINCIKNKELNVEKHEECSDVEMINRASSQVSKTGSVHSKGTEGGRLTSGSGSEVEMCQVCKSVDLDTISFDIDDNKAWDADTDQEVRETSRLDYSSRGMYLDDCKKHGVVPASYFLRHMHDERLEMKHHGLAAIGMRPISLSLMSNTNVLALDLTDNWLGYHGGLAVCDMLKENCYITNLVLSDNRLNLCAHELCRAFTLNSTLKRLNLSGNGFDDKSGQHFAEFITQAQCSVEYLNLSQNCLCEVAGVHLGHAIADNVSIKELDLSWNHLRRKGAISIAGGIKQNVSMKRINLAWNGFGLEGATSIGNALKINSTLESLDITNNRITTEGAVLIGKGLSVNESLKVLKMGKNPLQSAGCWGICAAILRNPNCVLSKLDFSDVLVNKDFDRQFKLVQDQLPSIRMTHGSMDPPLKPKARVHPMVKLMVYIEKNNLRLVDFFNKFDKDGSMSVTSEEFRQGLKETGIQMAEEDILFLMDELDTDYDGEINYSELVIGHTDFQDREKKNENTLPPLRPVTS